MTRTPDQAPQQAEPQASPHAEPQAVPAASPHAEPQAMPPAGPHGARPAEQLRADARQNRARLIIAATEASTCRRPSSAARW
jgi:hypothetical protein